MRPARVVSHARPVPVQIRPRKVTMRNREWAKARVVLPNGETVTLQALSAREADLVEKAFPRPQPPLKKDPTKGSLAEPIPDTADPVFERNIRQWIKHRERAQLAIAMGVQDGQGATFDRAADYEKQEAWLKSAVERMADEWLDDELHGLWLRLRGITVDGMVGKAIEVLITAPSGELPADAVNPIKIPEHYSMTEDGLIMRAAERFGQDPFEYPKTLEADQRAAFLAHEIIRQREESDRDGMLRAALGMLGVRAGV